MLDFFEMLNHCSPGRTAAYLIVLLLILISLISMCRKIVVALIKAVRKIIAQRMEERHIEKIFEDDINVTGMRPPVDDRKN